MFNKGQTAEKSTVCCDCHTRLANQGYYYMATNMKEFKNHEVSNALKKIQQTKR
jgi:cytochrome c553